MLFYIARRLVSAISVVLVTIIVSFLLFYAAPTDPAGYICGARCTPARVAEITHSLKLDEPVPQQLVGYVEGIFVGRDFTNSGVTTHCSAPCLGYSYQLGQPVTTLVRAALPVTVTIVLGAAVIFLSIGLWTGIAAARRRGTAVDRGLVMVSQGLGSIPYFVFALIISLYVPYYIHFMPEARYSAGQLTSAPFKWFEGFLLPWLTLGVFSSSLYTRYARASMIESLSEDYVRTARAKGISARRVVYKHALRAALTPITTIFGLDLAFQLSGALITEYIFGLPGLGVLTLHAFGRNDLPILMAGALIGAALLVAMNLIVDILYTVLDPRVRLT